ncbi:hypothetical protein JTB14_000065 [Gonioctena quinquepunctata]|nr:hypothetical protein JTB14_000065 [Gonioctena quinquepunctata]
MSILNHRQKTDSGTWILDSGCNDHMTSHRQKFCSFISYESVVEVAGGGVLRSTGYGDINLQLSKKNGGYQITLMKVLYVPELNENLLSMSLAAERGMKVIFGSNNAKIISKQGEIIAESTKIGRLHYIFENERRVFTNKAISKENQLWHQRLALLNFPDLKKMLSNHSPKQNIMKAAKYVSKGNSRKFHFQTRVQLEQRVL